MNPYIIGLYFRFWFMGSICYRHILGILALDTQFLSPPRGLFWFSNWLGEGSTVDDHFLQFLTGFTSAAGLIRKFGEPSRCKSVYIGHVTNISISRAPKAIVVSWPRYSCKTQLVFVILAPPKTESNHGTLNAWRPIGPPAQDKYEYDTQPVLYCYEDSAGRAHFSVAESRLTSPPDPSVAHPCLRPPPLLTATPTIGERPGLIVAASTRREKKWEKIC